VGSSDFLKLFIAVYHTSISSLSKKKILQYLSISDHSFFYQNKKMLLFYKISLNILENIFNPKAIK
jgi:hypothetical protein